MRTQFQALCSQGRSREPIIKGRGGKEAGIAEAASRQKGNSAAVCGVSEGLLEEMRSPLAGRGKGGHVRQEAQHRGRAGGARGQQRNQEGSLQAAVWRKWYNGSWRRQQRQQQAACEPQ